jgi:hypothetical protein
MARTKSRAQRKEAFVKLAGQMYDRLEDWYDQHPEASFEELEAALREPRRELMGATTATLVLGRDSGFRIDAPGCPHCGRSMVFKEYRPWTVKGLEGDTVLERAYYTCPTCCGEAFSPSGPEVATAA